MIEPLEHLLCRLAVRAGVEIDRQRSSQLVSYLVTLAAWNRTINLTSLDLRGFPESSLTRLIIEPIQAAKHLPASPFRWFDLGSGGGSPAIPLRVVAPHGLLTMVESRGRKAAFLREAARVCGLQRVDVVTTRIEVLPREVQAGSVEVFTIRAVRLDYSVAEVVSRLGAPSVRVVLFGPVDWSTLQTDFAAATTDQDLTVLVRRT